MINPAFTLEVQETTKQVGDRDVTTVTDAFLDNFQAAFEAYEKKHGTPAAWVHLRLLDDQEQPWGGAPDATLCFEASSYRRYRELPRRAVTLRRSCWRGTGITPPTLRFCQVFFAETSQSPLST